MILVTRSTKPKKTEPKKPGPHGLSPEQFVLSEFDCLAEKSFSAKQFTLIICRFIIYGIYLE